MQQLEISANYFLVDAFNKISETDLSLKELKIASTLSGTNSVNQSKDFFGNITEYGVGARGIMDIYLTNPDSINQPVLEICFKSSNGNTFSNLIAPYPLEKERLFPECDEYDYYNRNEQIYELSEEQFKKY